MNAPLGFDHRLLGELIARRWQEIPGYYTLNRSADAGWLEASWQARADHSGLELHWGRRAALHPNPELTAPA